MEDKPKFGIDADSAETEETKEVKAPVEKPVFGTGAEEINKPKFGAEAEIDSDTNTITPDSKPTFGAAADVEITDTAKPAFGADSIKDNNSDENKSVLSWIVNIFSMQPMGFWFKQYAFAILGFVIYTQMFATGSMFLGILNLILYPFTITILQEIGRNRSGGFLTNVFFGATAIASDGATVFILVFYAVIRFLIFMFKFVFSFVIGAIGILYMLFHAKKINS